MAGTGIVWPADAVSNAPSYTGRMLRNTQAPFLAGATAARPLGAMSGVRPGTPSNTVAATSSVLYTVTPFAGIIDLETAAISGPYAFAFNANVTGAITAAGGTPRLDAVYVQINDAAESDGTVGAPSIRIDYLAGTVNSGGVLVIAAVPPRSFVIANINVPVSGGGSPTVTWVAPYSVAAGGTLTANTFNAISVVTGYLGQYAEVTADTTATNNGLYRFDGTNWVLWEQGWTNVTLTVTNLTLGTGGAVLYSKQRVMNGTMELRAGWKLGTSASIGDVLVSPPVAISSWTVSSVLPLGSSTFIDTSAGATGRFSGFVYPAGGNLRLAPLASASGLMTSVAPTIPFAWTATDELHMQAFIPIGA